ncbi:hypothetical protein BDM02DRAFT_2512219 [Thelephora ganbajun]|uniref:Uncharacterized protein n=1 Tax=Thelephora ganbajun TaxID=370292 RepID=A0ACB6ZD44_THEGA|nr:hypothetical protein BDM02DRAFT_2512219 [Thelephora ganbajun]
MSSVQGYNSPATLTEEPEEEYIEYQQDQPEHQVEHPPAEHELHPEQEHQPESEPIASSSYSQALDRLSDMPPKDGNIGGRVSVADPTVLVESPPVGIVTLQDSNPPRSSQVIDWRNVTQTSLSGAVELMAVNANRPDDPQMTNATSARPPINQPVAAGDDGTGNNIDPNANGSTSNATNRNTGTGGRTTVARPNLASTSNVSLNPSRSQVQLAPSRPLSILERRPTGPGLVSYDPIRGDATTQVYLQDANGEGDPAGVPNRPGSRNTIMRVSVARPRSVLSPTDGIAVGDGPGPGSRRASRLVSGQDFLAGVPVIEEPPVSVFSFLLPFHSWI